MKQIGRRGSTGTRIVRCKKCGQEFEQHKFGENGCYSQPWWLPKECPSCGSTEKPGVSFMIPVFLSDLEKPKTDLKKTKKIDKRMNKKK